MFSLPARDRAVALSRRLFLIIVRIGRRIHGGSHRIDDQIQLGFRHWLLLVLRSGTIRLYVDLVVSRVFAGSAVVRCVRHIDRLFFPINWNL